MSTDEQLVVFRKWLDCDAVIALFPELPADLEGWFCDAYEHVGQHGGADYQLVIAASRPALPSEYESLARELTRIGYKLRPIKRAMRSHHDERRREARRNKLICT